MAASLEAMEEMSAKHDFVEAVEFIGTMPVRLTEAVQRRLYGLHCVATKGAPADAPEDAPEETPAITEEQAMAWREAYAEAPDKITAMEMYVDQVSVACPDFLEWAPPEAGDGDQLEALKRQLAGAGISEKAPEPEAAVEDVFEAARRGAEALKPFLGGDINVQDEEGLTPLIHAVDAEKIDAVEALLDAGAHVEIQDEDGMAALHYAALLGAERIAELLVERGADRCQTDGAGLTPVKVAHS
eukprot:CAMPEP_0119275420 /NCGR_PEP_ID=MMETSP1329-20130426/13704_1 /TAXON_ID=114041 /ORGANISM="Genus nov. species nov., Strain RCC1024" /LENGTH=242 /DNA_ID=CAMNT_0007275801 /DNA_START=170 /DNA_END=894 /DNA_ORIENTATION=+